MGNVEYGDYFLFFHGCTVGSNCKNGEFVRPKLGSHVIMFANSMIYGDSKIGSYVILSANSCVKDETIPDNSIVFGQSPNLIIKQRSEDEMLSRFRERWLI